MASKTYRAPHSMDTGDGGVTKCPVEEFDDLRFDDPVQAFHTKTTWEVFRALAVLRLCSLDCLVDNSLRIMKFCRRICGGRFLSAVFKPTFYRQFVGGESVEEIQDCVTKLTQSEIRPLLACTFEEDSSTNPVQREIVYNRNLEKTLECIGISSSLETPKPMIQLKISGLMSGDLLVCLGKMYDKGRKQELVYDLSQKLIDEKQTLITYSLTKDQREDTKNALSRLRKIGKMATEKGVHVLVDAEYTYMNSALTWIALAMMVTYNQERPVIWNSYQCYLKTSVYQMEHDLKLVQRLEACFGAKVVRGAYMTQERNRAIAMGYPDPVWETYEDTTKSYHRGIDFALKWIHDPGNNNCDLMVATHNEDSVRYVIHRMKDFGMDKQSGSVSFGQLLGMGDPITYPLAAAGFVVYKCVPYGAVEEVLPYLARRAMENKTVVEGARKEREMLSAELNRRILNSCCCRRSRDEAADAGATATGCLACLPSLPCC